MVSDTDDDRDRRLPRLPWPVLFSPSAFVVIAVVGVCGVLVGAVGRFPGSGYVGLFGATAVHGVTARRARYPETAAAGAVAAGVGTVLDVLLVGATAGIDGPGLGLTGGAVVALFGRFVARRIGGIRR